MAPGVLEVDRPDPEFVGVERARRSGRRTRTVDVADELQNAPGERFATRIEVACPGASALLALDLVPLTLQQRQLVDLLRGQRRVLIAQQLERVPEPIRGDERTDLLDHAAGAVGDR